jgi:hypothetical protein
MKKTVIALAIFIYCSGYSQDKKPNKWYSTADLEFIVPHKLEYDYSTFSTDYNAYVGTSSNIKGFGTSFGLSYSINYQIFYKLSFGIVTGLQNQRNPDYGMYKLGARLRYFFVDSNNVYVYLEDSNIFSLNKNQFKSGNNTRLGIGFPVLKRQKINLNINVFGEQNFLRLQGSKPLFTDEKPKTSVFKSYGISLGIKF